MTGVDVDRLLLAAGAWEFGRSPSSLRTILHAEGRAGLESAVAGLDDDKRARAEVVAVEMAQRGVGVLFYGDGDFPEALAVLANPPPMIFYIGDPSVLREAAIGMCGSRSATDAGTRAARHCGLAVARAGLTIVSGYARGVDMATHRAALEAGGRTIIVLAEGILRFRVKRSFSADHDPSRVLVISQFRPTQGWQVGTAMARNAVIAGLGKALVVVEAHECGGTLNAGLQALDIGRPVLALEYESETTPAGNSILISRGALPIRRPRELAETLATIGDPTRTSPEQIWIPLA